MSLSNLLKNEFFATFVSFLVLFVVGLVSLPLWTFMFSIIFSFVLSDAILNLFIHGGEGWAKIFSGTGFSNKGYAFFAFLIGIIIGTLVTSVIIDILLKYLQTQFDLFTAMIMTDGVAVLAVLVDLEWRFY